jgi:carnitine-CoA ligase
MGTEGDPVVDWWSSSIPQARECVLPDVLRRHAERQPDKVFAAFADGSTWTYAQICTAANMVARDLADRGVGKGDHVLSWCTSVADMIRVWFGANQIGAVYVPLNPALRGRLLEHAVNNVTNARIMVADTGLQERLQGIETGTLEQVRAPYAEADVRTDTGPTIGPSEPIEPWDPYAVLLTSGTTGPSKGVVCSYVHIATTAAVVADDGWFGPNDRYLLSLPIFHAGGVIALCNGVYAGASIAVMDRFETSRFWDVVRATGATHATILGAMGHFLLTAATRPDDADQPLRKVILGPVTESTPDFARRFGVEVVTIFNMTETSVPIISEPGPTEPGVLGRPRAGVEIRVVDAHDLEVPMGQPGELIVRADRPWSMNSGYSKAPEATAAAWRNGWFHTGDMVRRSAAGDVYFVDRKKDSIRRRGENISSIELEAELMAFGPVADAAAVGVPSEFSEDDVLAVLVAKPGHTVDPVELVEFLRSRVPHYMVPRYIRLVDDLPHTPSNKIEKFKLRAEGITADTWDRERAGILLKNEAPR